MRTQAPGFWDNPKEAEIQMRKVRGLKSWVDSYNDAKEAIDDLQILFDFAKEEEASPEEVDEQFRTTQGLIEARELRNMLRKE